MQLTPTGSAESVDDPVLTGAPAQESSTNPVKLLPGVIVAVTVAASPGAARVTEVGLIASANPSAGMVAAALTGTTWDCDDAWIESPL